MSRLRKLSPNVWEDLQLGAGVLLCDNRITLNDYDELITATYRNIMGATSGGVTISVVPEYFNNAPQGHATLLDLAIIRGYTITITGSFVSQNETLTQRLLGASRSKVYPSEELGMSIRGLVPQKNTKASPLNNIWWLGEYGSDGDEGYIAIHMRNAMPTSGVSLVTEDSSFGKVSFSFQAWVSTSDANSGDAPCEILFVINKDVPFFDFFVQTSSEEDEASELKGASSGKVSLAGRGNSEKAGEPDGETPSEFYVRLTPKEDEDSEGPGEDVSPYVKFFSTPTRYEYDDEIMDTPIFKY